MLQRQVAYKVHISDISGGKTVFDGDRFTHIEMNEKKISRANVLGNVVDKYSNEEKRYCVLTLDDGSGQIRLKGFSDSFELLNHPEIGNTVYVIGVIKYFNNEIYITPEIIRQVDPRWLSVRRLELGKAFPFPAQPTQQSGFSQVSQPTQTAYSSTPPSHSSSSLSSPSPPFSSSSSLALSISEEKAPPQATSSQYALVENPKSKTLSVIKREKEIDLSKLVVLTSMSHGEMSPIINELLAEGEIYELKPGHFCSVN